MLQPRRLPAQDRLERIRRLRPALDPLPLAHASGCSAYDCEFVPPARFLAVPLVTADARLARAFPEHARALE